MQVDGSHWRHRDIAVDHLQVDQRHSGAGDCDSLCVRDFIDTVQQLHLITFLGQIS